MKRADLVIFAAALAIAGWSIPRDYVPTPWRAGYARIFGEASYREAPPDRVASIPPLDLDRVCPPEYDAWRQAREIEGVHIEAVSDCVPDNPWDVAAAVRGTNHVSDATLMQTLFAADAVEKGEDRDGDGDPDVIDIRLEVMELNGKSPDIPDVVPRFEIGPGITPGFWVFAPKTRGMTTINFDSLVANRVIRLPAPVIRIEQGDEVRITLENAHYLPHTIHFHGVDHPFETPGGEGNDGVPLFSEHPVAPGQARTYWLQPRHAGTGFYHCHVQPQTHILMGLQGMIVVEENRPDNWLQTFNIGAGRVRSPSRAVRATHDREYDLHYLEIDTELNDRIQEYTDPRLVSRSIHRGYNITRREPDYFVLNGRSFPYTLRESLIIVRPGERNRLRVLNGGSEDVALHLHGHKPILTHRDGVPLGDGERIQRDVFTVAPAQRIDLELSTHDDGLDAFGAGAWLMHDHREQAVTSNGIGPGGDVSAIVYEQYLGPRGLPRVVGGVAALAPYFAPEYYAGELPVFSGSASVALADPGTGSPDRFKTALFWITLIGVSALLLVRIMRRDDT